MKTSKRGVQLIKDFEGLRLNAYQDAVGIWTIGYGHTSDAEYPVKAGAKITKAYANKLLQHDIEEAEAVLDRLLANTQLNSNQYGAVISLMFNIGNAAFAKSTMCRKLRNGDIQGAGREFSKWVKAGKRTLEGLRRRRAAETELYYTPDYLGNKPVTAPKVEGAALETEEAREAKGAVASDKPSFLSKLFAPVAAIFTGGAGISAQDGFDIVDRMQYSFYGAPVWVWVAGGIGLIGLYLWNNHRNSD